MKNFISANRVFLAGLVASIILVLQQQMQSGPVSWKAMGLALAVTVVSYIANQWKAKTASILGIIGSVASAIGLQLQNGYFSWIDLGVVTLIGVLGYLSEGLKAPENREVIPNKP
jgi:hypothetical protein